MKMNPLFSAISSKDALTDNGALTNSTSQDFIVDLFFLAGASREMSKTQIETLLQKAWNQNKNLTLKLIFWAGDIRQGIGERRFFTMALKFLEKNYPDILRKVVGYVPFYNRWDSLFHLTLPNQPGLDLICGLVGEALMTDKNGLCAKWMPRDYCKKFDLFRENFKKTFGLKDKAYRKLIVGLSKTVEQQMSRKKWDEIVYEHVPSVAMNKYRKAFYRNDEGRFKNYIEAVTKGEKKINASAIFPHDIYKSYKNGGDQASINAQWKALPDYLKDSDEKILPVCDVSGSMEGNPMAISVALGIYFSERNKSIFKDGFITFSSRPKLQYLTGDLCERIRQLETAEWTQNTNLLAVFGLILSRAKEEHLPADSMPTTLLIISDMEFDDTGERNTNFEKIKILYEESGYTLPKIIFWNVNGRAGNVPIKITDKGVGLVSGSSPSIVKSILGGEISPQKVVERTLLDERYKQIEC